MALFLVYNIKGGVGKTSIASSVSRDLDYYYSTNDTINSSIVLSSYKKVITEISEEFIDKNNVIFDAGGFQDEKINLLLKRAKKVFIPLECDATSLFSLNEYFNDLKNINDTIYFILNKVEHQKDKEETLEFLYSLGVKQENIFILRKSRMFKKAFNENKSMSNIMQENKLNRHLYKGFYKEYYDILKLFKS